MTTPEPSSLTSNGSVLPPPDKYRGAVVEVRARNEARRRPTIPPDSLNLLMNSSPQDLQLPPAFSLPRTELIARAIELAYDRDFSHIPYVMTIAQCCPRPLPLPPMRRIHVSLTCREN